MSAWKLVEAETEVNDATQGNESSETDRRNGGRGGRGRGRSSNGSSGRGSGRGRGGGRFTFRSKADRSYFAYLAVQQIDNIFCPDSLCMDTYVRAYMDEAGYVPVALVCNYYNVSCYGCSYYDILNKLKEVSARSKYYEVDGDNETIRLKEGWEKFILPNAFGGRGLPRYIKQPSFVYTEEGAENDGTAEEVTEEVIGAADNAAEPTNWSEADTTAIA